MEFFEVLLRLQAERVHEAQNVRQLAMFSAEREAHDNISAEREAHVNMLTCPP